MENNNEMIRQITERIMSGWPRMWICSAQSPYGNPYGAVIVMAPTRELAIERARPELMGWLAASTYVPAQQYIESLLANLDAIEEHECGIHIDWSPTERRA